MYRATVFVSLSLVLLLMELVACGQTTRLRGQVHDAQTGEPLPLVNVSFMGTAIGTITDFDGKFFLETRTPGDSITLSMLGYTPQSHPVRVGAYQDLIVRLEPHTLSLDAVVVRPGENPAHPILRNIIANKHRNNPDNLASYAYESYNKIQVDLNNVTEDMRDDRVFRQFQFIFDLIDTNAITGKTFIPIFISEAISDFYHQSEPKLQREVIRATQVSGVRNESVAQFTGKFYQDVNIYDNFINVFNQGLVSPIANAGLLYYKYYLVDSGFIGNRWCYQVSFKPRRSMEPTFTGDFWVNDTTWAVVRAQVRLSEDVNLNFVNDLVATMEYSPLNDSVWFPSNLMLFVDFNLTDRTQGFFGRKTSSFRNVRINEPIPKHLAGSPEVVTIQDNAMNLDVEFWQQARPFELTPKEASVYSMVDSLKQVPLIESFIDIMEMLVTYYYIVGYVEIGPYFKTYSFNQIEGNRFRLSGRTSNALSTRLMLSGFVAYGDKDNRFKYGMGAQYMFGTSPRRSLIAEYSRDVEQLGQSPDALTEDNLLTSILRRNPNFKLSLNEEALLEYEHEWFTGLSNRIRLSHKTIFPTEYIPFVPVNGNPGPEGLTTTSLSVTTRWLKDERYISGAFERVSLGSPFPEVKLTLTGSRSGVLGSMFTFLMANASFNHRVNVNPIGYLRYLVEAGKLFGSVPYPLLKLHEGNETYAYDRFAYNMMNYYEFASDQWASITLEHHFQGFFLNRIPLIRRLKWREVVMAKGLIGSIASRNMSVWEFPDGLTPVTGPYVEAGVGIENIFRVFRINAIWRITHLNRPNIQGFGLRVGVQIIF